MSIQSEITRISGNVNSALSAIADKGVSVPSGANSDDLATLIGQVETGIDTSDATASASEILSGETAYVNGEKITGTMTNRGAVSQSLNTSTTSYTVPAGYHNGSGKVSITTEEKTVTPSSSVQTITPSSGKVLSKVTVNASTGIDTSDATAAAGDILSGKTAYVDGEKITGTIATKNSSNLTASGATVSVPAGYYASAANKSVATATQATPSISVDSSGKITASATQTAGYVSAGTKTGTKQLTTQAAKTVTPSSSEQTAVASGVYTTGAVKVAGDANLKAENIKEGVSIFGVNGTLVIPDDAEVIVCTPTSTVSQIEVNYTKDSYNTVAVYSAVTNTATSAKQQICGVVYFYIINRGIYYYHQGSSNFGIDPSYSSIRRNFDDKIITIAREDSKHCFFPTDYYVVLW